MGKTKGKPQVGIIGGTGKTGTQFKNFFTSSGAKVKIASRSTKLSPIDLAKESDVVVISVPIRSTLKVIRDIAPHVRKDALLMDLTSLKEEPVKAMLKYSGSEVIGMHPMFGPSVSSFKNQTIVLCPARTKRWLPWLKSIIKKSGAKIKLSTPKKHDEIMAVIQGLMHFSSITFCNALKEAKVDIDEALSYTSPVFKLSLDMTGRILNQDPKLYADIELLNPDVKKIISVYSKSISKLQNIINRCDEKAFVKYFNDSAEHLGRFKKEAESESDYLIERISKK